MITAIVFLSLLALAVVSSTVAVVRVTAVDGYRPIASYQR